MRPRLSSRPVRTACGPAGVWVWPAALLGWVLCWLGGLLGGLLGCLLGGLWGPLCRHLAF